MHDLYQVHFSTLMNLPATLDAILFLVLQSLEIVRLFVSPGHSLIMTLDQEAKTLFTVSSEFPFIFDPHNERFRCRENISFYSDGVGSRSTNPNPAVSSREVTPVRQVFSKTYLRFDVDNIQGQTRFLFGRDRETCDVYVWGPNVGNTIFVVELINGGRGSMLINKTKEGLNVDSPIYPRLHFRGKRVLHPMDKVSITIGKLVLHVEFLSHRGHEALHEQYLEVPTCRGY